MEPVAPIKYEVLDEQGIPTGEILDQQTVHTKELWHAVVNVWVVNSQGELLMQLRAPDVELSPNVWDVSVGSHLRPGETPQTAAERCLRTELGISVSSEQLNHLFNIQCANPMPNHITHKVLGHVFLVQMDVDIKALKYDSTKITRLAWVPLMQLMTDVGNEISRQQYFPRANNYYPQLFNALQSWIA